MPLLNYTTSISVDKSIAETQKKLAKSGASKIMSEYDQNGNITALSFELHLENGQPVGFRLPTDWRPVLQILQHDPKVPGRLVTEDQARRVAWRITKDWIEAQLAIIETRMVTTAQVFLPYMITKNGQSMYEYVGSNTQLLLGEGVSS